MMEIGNNPSAQTQKEILDKLGIKSASDVVNESSDKLGQEDFLTLMTAQLQNQDPMAPMDNGDFIAQMAQFSTVTGIEEMASSMKAMAAEVQQLRVASISNVMGHSVLVPGDKTSADANVNYTGCSSWIKPQLIRGSIFMTPKQMNCLKSKQWGPKLLE